MTARELLPALTALALAGCAAATGSPEQVIARLGPSLTIGMDEAPAVRLLQDNSFHCRELPRDDWTHRNPAVVRTVNCGARGQAEPGGYSVVYVSLGIDSAGRLAEVDSGSYGSGTYPAARQ